MTDKNINFCEDLPQRICEKIKKENIKPRPRWFFIAKNIAFWSAFILSLIAGGLALSTIIFVQINSDFDLHRSLAGDFFNFIIFTLPYFWLVLFLLFILAGFFYLRRTKTGYRYRFILVFFAIISTSIFFGLLAHWIGFGQSLENLTRQKIPFYGAMEFNRAKMWIRPDKGFLAGTITNILNNNNFEIDDFASKTWQIETSHSCRKRNIKMIPGENIKIIGERTGTNSFHAFELRPWGLKCYQRNCQYK